MIIIILLPVVMMLLVMTNDGSDDDVDVVMHPTQIQIVLKQVHSGQVHPAVASLDRWHRERKQRWAQQLVRNGEKIID